MTNIFQKAASAPKSKVDDLQQPVPEHNKEQEKTDENDENQGKTQKDSLALEVEKQGMDTDAKMENDIAGEKPQNPSTPLTQVLEAAMDNMNDLETELEQRMHDMLEEATKCEHWDVYVKEQSQGDAELLEFYQGGMDSIAEDPEAETRTWLQFVKAKGIERTCPLTMAYLKDLEDVTPKHPRLNQFIADKWEALGKDRAFCELLHCVEEDKGDFEKWLANPGLVAATGDSFQAQPQIQPNDNETQESRKDETENDENVTAKFRYPSPPSSGYPNINFILKSAAEACIHTTTTT